MAISLTRAFNGRSPLSEKALSEILDGMESFDYMIQIDFGHEFDWGHHYYVHYHNGYGASIVKHRNSLGDKEDLWELALIDQDNDLIYDEDGIFQDVCPYRTEEDVVRLCAEIRDRRRYG